jgi:hypothetical protein
MVFLSSVVNSSHSLLDINHKITVRFQVLAMGTIVNTVYQIGNSVFGRILPTFKRKINVYWTTPRHRSRDSAVIIATGYGLEDQKSEFESR